MSTRTRDAIRAFADNRLAVIGFVVLVLVTLFCFLGPLFTPR